MYYFTFDEAGEITGAYKQDLQPAHESGNWIEVTEQQYAQRHELMVVEGELQAKPDPDPAVVLAARRAVVWERIKAHRRHLGETGGYAVMVGAVEKWFQSDPKSQVQQLGLARKADRVEAADGDMDAQFAGASGLWKTFDNSFVAMTANVAHAVFDAAEAQDGALFACAEQHRMALYAAPDPDAYDWSTGWPAVYGGA